MDRATYFRLENGADNRIYFDVLVKICKVLDVSLWELVNYGEETEEKKGYNPNGTNLIIVKCRMCGKTKEIGQKLDPIDYRDFINYFDAQPIGLECSCNPGMTNIFDLISFCKIEVDGWFNINLDPKNRGYDDLI